MDRSSDSLAAAAVALPQPNRPEAWLENAAGPSRTSGTQFPLVPRQPQPPTRMAAMAAGPLLDGKSVLVTGGTRGIGEAHAIGLAALGARAGITGRDQARTEAVAADIPAARAAQPWMPLPRPGYGGPAPARLDSDRALQPESSVI